MEDDEDNLEPPMRNSRTSVNRDAVMTAIEEYKRRCRVQALLDRLGSSDTFMLHDELMKMREAEKPVTECHQPI